MKYIINSTYNPMDIRVVLNAIPNSTLQTTVYDIANNDRILDRKDVITSPKELILKLPITSSQIMIEIHNIDNGRLPLGKDNSFLCEKIELLPLKTFDVDLTNSDKEFIDFIKTISTQLPNIPADGKLRTSPSGKFKIVIFDKLRSYSGEYLPSPAMIGKETGTIEISKEYMLSLTQSQRIAVLCHEYGHFYKNPEMGLDIGNEYGADLNGLTLYLGNGFPIYGYVNAFNRIFDKSSSLQNDQRAILIHKFAKEIYEGKHFGKPYNLK